MPDTPPPQSEPTMSFGPRPGATDDPSRFPPDHEDAPLQPGTVLMGRYRLATRLGKGGMGEVYQADDLKLNQPVALKFLPRMLERDPERLKLLLDEVRIARRVAHPNVCRVYDVVETDAGTRFITMEFVRGEDLASLLRRIGRMPPEKAIEVARQVCAGLAAIHAEGILHRDLKPANILLDERGRARIVDFGVAVPDIHVRGFEASAGTPAYMAPEQLRGEEATPQSDVYSLGLVLYELFTGKRVYESNDTQELLALQDGSTPANPSSHVKELDPSVERAILNCMARDPYDRPPSAMAVAASLPGGDPLAAALAAGELPSPNVVAASHGERTLTIPLASAITLFIALGTAAVLWLVSETRQSEVVPPGDHPATLIDAARDIIEAFGYERDPADFEYGLKYSDEFFHYVEQYDPNPNRWKELTEAPFGLLLWYRHLPVPLINERRDGRMRPEDPTPTAGDMLVQVGSEGRLHHFRCVTGDDTFSGAAAQPEAFDWNLAFELAGLNKANFTEIEPKYLDKFVHADDRRAWLSSSPYPGTTDAQLIIEAASLEGRPVQWFIHPPTFPMQRDGLPREPIEKPAPDPLLTTLGNYAYPIFMFSAIIPGIPLAIRNLRMGRGDRRTAMFGAIVAFISLTIAWLPLAHHVTAVWGEWRVIRGGLGEAVFYAALLYALYMALEPSIRLHRPQLIVSWIRVARGKLADPIVGRDLLLGVAFGLLIRLIDIAVWYIPVAEGRLMNRPAGVSTDALLGPVQAIAEMSMYLDEMLNAAFMAVFVLVLLRKVLRKSWLTIPAFYAMMWAVSLGFYEGSVAEVQVVCASVLAAIVTLIVSRFGLLVGFIAFAIAATAAEFPFTLNFSAWHSTATWLWLIVVAFLTLFGLKGAIRAM